MKVNLCNTLDHLLHSNSQAPQLISMGQYTLLLMYWTTAHLVCISIKVNQHWDLGIQAPNTDTNLHTLLMTEHNPSDFAVPTSGGNGLADLSFLNESTMATALTMYTTTVVTTTGIIPTTAVTPATSASAPSSIAPSDTSGSRVGDWIIQRIDHMTLNMNQPNTILMLLTNTKSLECSSNNSHLGSSFDRFGNSKPYLQSSIVLEGKDTTSMMNGVQMQPWRRTGVHSYHTLNLPLIQR